MRKAFKYRIYPTRSQREQIERTFGCCRWVWNRAHEMRLSAFQAHAKTPGFGVLCAAILGWKKESPWLADADSMALQQAVRDLARAWESFFREPGRVGLPKFKSKRAGTQSYRTNANGNGIRVAVPEKENTAFPRGSSWPSTSLATRTAPLRSTSSATRRSARVVSFRCLAPAITSSLQATSALSGACSRIEPSSIGSGGSTKSRSTCCSWTATTRTSNA